MALVNAFGKMGLEGTLQKMAQYLQQIASNIGRTYPDSSGRSRVALDTISTGLTLGTVTTVTTVTTLTNQTQQAGYSTAYDQYAQMLVMANTLRAQIKVTP